MRRRDFITLLGGAAAIWPLAARAQQREPMRRIGVLMNMPADDPEGQARVAAFLQGLREAGWAVGRNAQIHIRWGMSDAERSRKNATELVALTPDVLFATTFPTVAALQQATRAVPIVFAGVIDPVGAGLVASLARPGGNTTGLSLQQTGYTGKRFELFREVVPALRRLAILANAGSPGAMLEMSDVQAIARPLGLEVVTSEIRRAEDIALAFKTFAGRVDALYICPDGLVTANSIKINILAAGARLPTTYVFREDIAAGGLMSYGPSFPHVYRRAATLRPVTWMVDCTLVDTAPVNVRRMAASRVAS